MTKHIFKNTLNEYLVFTSKWRKKQGFETHARNLKLHILPYFENMYVEDITKADILNWESKILDKNFSSSFNHTLFYNFSSFMNYCVDMSIINTNIVTSTKKFPKIIDNKEHNIYNLFEFIKFRKHLEDCVDKEFYTFMFFYGTRTSETMAIRFCDINGMYVHIAHSIHRRGKRELDTPKNQSSVRYIKISFMMLIRILKLKKYYLKKYNTFNSNFYVFGGLNPLSTTTLDRHKRNAAKSANLIELTQHEFRHSYASRLVHKKKPIDFISKSLGHSRISTTVDIYVHQQKRKHSIFQRFLEKRINF